MPKAQTIHTVEAPKAIGPYSQGVKIPSGSSLLFVSGQLPVNPKTGKLIESSIGEQTQQVIDNLEQILKAGGSSLGQVVRVDIFLKDLKKDFSAVNEEYGKRFNGPVPPARQTVQVSELPLGAPLEISCIATVEET